jgi:hypothetical protein
MMHNQRKFHIFKLESFKELAEILFAGTQCLCTGFQLGDFIFINDSTSEDGAQEYAVVKHGMQIESLTVSWVDSIRELLDLFHGVMEAGDTPMKLKLENLKLDYSPYHHCYLCD